MFVTNFVLYSLFECYSFQSVQLDYPSLENAIDALLSFKDKNVPQGQPIYTFWPQILINGTWTAQPQNLINLFDLYFLLPYPI